MDEGTTTLFITVPKRVYLQCKYEGCNVPVKMVYLQCKDTTNTFSAVMMITCSAQITDTFSFYNEDYLQCNYKGY